jgi:DNA-binding LacI/PurR family transcriptional regulator
VTHKNNHTVLDDDPFYSIIIAGAEACLSQYNYHLLLTTVDDGIMARPQAFSPIRQGRVDGLILAGPHITPPFILHMLASRVPVVLVDNCLSRVPMNCVLCDNVGGAYAAARHLIEHGHKRIVFLAGPNAWVSVHERSRGYTQALTEAGLEPHIFYANDTTIATGEMAMREALANMPDLTAVCATNDAVAIGAMRAAGKAGRHVPNDVAVIGFDDVSWASISEPALSTIHVYKRRMRQLAGQCLLDAIQDADAAPIKTIVSTTLVIRQSCGCPESSIGLVGKGGEGRIQG